MEHSQTSQSAERPNNEGLLEELKRLHAREFLVGRKIDPKTRVPEHFETGWIIEDVRELPNGHLGVTISVPEKNIAKRLYLEELLSWQPEEEAFEGDTIVRPHELEHHDQPEHLEEELGEVAIEASGIAEVVDNEGSYETELSADDEAAEARILAVLGEDGKGQNMLAEVLREAGTTPGEIRAALADKEGKADMRKSVRHTLMRRMTDLLAQGGHFHERVQRNDPNNLKSPEGNHGYDKSKYRSDEYVVLLALAKLDGSFDTSMESNNYADLRADDAKQGQHRQASDTLLKSFADENAPAAPERSVTDDEEIMQARRAVDTMLEELRAHNRLNTEQFHHIEHILYQQMPNLDEMDEQTNMLVARLHQTYDVIQTTLNELNRLKDSIDEHTREGIARRQVFESAEATIRTGMNVLSTDFAYSGIGMIDRMTSDARYDANMQHEYRFRATQLLNGLKDTQQTALSILESVQL